MIVKIVNNSDNALPQYETGGSAGLDVRSNEDGILNPGEFKLVKTGLFVEIPSGYEIQVRPRSGMALKYGVTVLNSPGTIDSDYRGEICVILINHSQTDFKIERGMRIAQMIIAKYKQAKIFEVESLDETARGEGGFGSTGV